MRGGYQEAAGFLPTLPGPGRAVGGRSQARPRQRTRDFVPLLRFSSFHSFLWSPEENASWQQPLAVALHFPAVRAQIRRNGWRWPSSSMSWVVIRVTPVEHERAKQIKSASKG